MSCYMTVTEAANARQNDILTAKEVKDRLRCGLSTVYDLFEAGELHGFRLGHGKKNGIRIWATSVNELMARNANTPRPTQPPPAPAEVPPLPPRKRGRPPKVIQAGELLSVRPRRS